MHPALNIFFSYYNLHVSKAADVHCTGCVCGINTEEVVHHRGSFLAQSQCKPTHLDNTAHPHSTHTSMESRDIVNVNSEPADPIALPNTPLPLSSYRSVGCLSGVRVRGAAGIDGQTHTRGVKALECANTCPSSPCICDQEVCVRWREVGGREVGKKEVADLTGADDVGTG